MKDLLIGNTAQLAHYFPSTIQKISSRNISSDIFLNEWDRVYICFAEQRTFKKEDQLFDQVNFEYCLILFCISKDFIFNFEV